MIEALEKVMPTFDPDITKIASRNLIDKRDIETRAGVFATKVKPGCPVEVELTDAKSREVIEELQVDAVLVATGRVPSTKNLNLQSVGIETMKRSFAKNKPERVKRLATKLLKHRNANIRISAARYIRSEDKILFKRFINTEKESWVRKAVQK